MSRETVSIPAGTSRAAALATLREAFTESGIDNPALDARVLLGDALGIDASELALRPEAAIEAGAAARLSDHATRRLAHEPVARILGTREFWGLPFALSPETLIPRPDSETLVETALACFAGASEPGLILDLGTGSGCLLVALLHELPQSLGIGIDRSPGALAVARANAERNGVGGRMHLVAGDWAKALTGPFDLVVSNPPYIPTCDIAGLAPDVRDYDPALALDGGPDGLDAYRAILEQVAPCLAPGGRLVLEIGAGQGEDLRRLAEAAGYRWLRAGVDLGGHERALAFALAESDGEAAIALAQPPG